MSLWGNTDTGASIPKYIYRGQVTKVEVTAGGTLYDEADTVAFDVAPAGGVTATGTLVIEDGVVTGVTITNPGSGYVTAPDLTITTSTGSGATFSVTVAPVVVDPQELVFVDADEAALQTNRDKGFYGPGWYQYKEYTDADGNTRYKTELLVAMSVDASDAGDAGDDLFVPDVETTVTIDTQPADQTTISGAATFTVAATLDPAGTLTYQWQRKAASASRWTKVNGETSASIVLAAQTEANDGDQYRVVVAGDGAKAVTSDPATLTFGD